MPFPIKLTVIRVIAAQHIAEQRSIETVKQSFTQRIGRLHLAAIAAHKLIG